ncbi:MAG TPA: cytochrome c-type biogenesis protein CcmH [Gemmatimonadaceae bacterium]|nr:cytochrome c-type biogenesis protein CcmH [Gemmatimonadaceae bacterium]
MTDSTISRRQFLGAVATGLAAAAIPSALIAQGVQQGSGQQISAATNMAMDDGRYRPVRLPSKGSGPSMAAKQRDELERHIHCQCGCTLDVYTCRTTDFTCSVSPAMHHDVMALVDGGYSAQEIINAFVHVYGEKVLMAPPKRGFDLTGYLTPFAALGGGVALVVALLRKWRPATADGAPVAELPVDATPDELARLDAAMRSDDS